MVIAYLRVSTEKQFLANQKEEILRFAEKNGLSIDKWYTETVSGSVSTKERKLAPQDATGNHDNSEFVHQKTGGAV